MSESLTSQLDTVLALAEKATPGEWKVRVGRGEDFFVQAPRIDPTHPYDIEVLGDDTTLYPTRRGDADLIVALVNLIREHGPTIRAAVGGEAVAWMLRRKRDDFVRGCYATEPTAESVEFAELDGDYYTPLYTSPPATVDVGALRELVGKWRTRMPANAGDSARVIMREACADELAALIGKEA